MNNDPLSSMKRGHSGFVALLLCLALSAGCDRESYAPVVRVPVPDEAVVFSYGALSDESGEGELTWVRAGAFSASGRYAAVLDGGPPYLRILDLEEGTLRLAAGRGEGPGELEGPFAIAFFGDSIVAVLNRNRIERFGVDGDWIGNVRLSEYGLNAMSITTACGGRTFVYGVPQNFQGMDEIGWLHEIDLATPGHVEARLAIPGGVGENLRFGGTTALRVDGSDEGVWLWHEQRELGRAAGHWISCDGSPNLVVDRYGTDPGESLAVTGGRVFVLPDTSFAGAVVHGRSAVRAYAWKEDELGITGLRVVEGNHCHGAELMGDWKLLALNGDRMMISQTDPYPTVRIIDGSWMTSNMVRVRCRA